MGQHEKRKHQDPVQRLLRQQREAYDESQQSERPRPGVIWFAVDRRGEVACCDSRESGNVPLDVFSNSMDDHLILFEYFVRPSEEKMGGDPVTDHPKQGLYFYDIVEYLTIDGYELLGVPEDPRKISDFPTDICNFIEKVQFDGIFRDTKKLFVKKHWPCV